MDQRIKAILVTLDHETSIPWTVSRLARSVGLSASRLRHLFKHETGTSLKHYVKDVRMRRAEHLLRTSFFSIKQIADEAGNLSGSHFSREFKKMFGVSPTTYRRRFGTNSKRQNDRS